MHIGNKVFLLRKKAGMSQEELAEKLGISRQAVSRWETGEAVPEPEKIVQLSKLFSVTTDHLLLDEAETKPKAQETVQHTAVESRETSGKTGWPAALKWAAGLGAAAVLAMMLALFLAWRASGRMIQWYSGFGKMGTALFFTWRAAVFHAGMLFATASIAVLAIYAQKHGKPSLLFWMLVGLFGVVMAILLSGIVLDAPVILTVMAWAVFLLFMYFKAKWGRKHP